MARPKRIDDDKLEKLAVLGCSNRDIATLLDCDEKTLRNRFSKDLAYHRAIRHLTLHAAQWKSAMGGNTTMLIWLGKNELGQSDKRTYDYDYDRVRDEPAKPIHIQLEPIQQFKPDRFIEVNRAGAGAPRAVNRPPTARLPREKEQDEVPIPNRGAGQRDR